jgi:hypothetical protein
VPIALRGRRSLHDLFKALLEPTPIIFEREIEDVADFDADRTQRYAPACDGCAEIECQPALAAEAGRL